MSAIVFVEASHGTIKKVGFEGVVYGKLTSSPVTAVVCGEASADQLASLGEYGADKVLHVNQTLSASACVDVISQAAEKEDAKWIIFPFDNTGKAIAPRLSARLKAGLVSGALGVPSADGVIKKNVFSGKAIAQMKINTDRKVIAFSPNSVGLQKSGGAAAVESFAPEMKASKIHQVETRKLEGDIPLPEAELVVSAGRGMKGPENWGMVEDLARSLGAATACSRPVADAHWRPHHEHVGQTGVAIRPNLYIAIGISGAIQHLAGVNQSKVIVVINNDPEAPFFKAADYGVVGDAFQVIPKLTEAVKKFKASHN